jgi:hypothetical protein
MSAMAIAVSASVAVERKEAGSLIYAVWKLYIERSA